MIWTSEMNPFFPQHPSASLGDPDLRTLLPFDFAQGPALDLIFSFVLVFPSS